jgi:hypothetical protein
VEPGSVLYKKPLVIIRGAFRPILCVHLDMVAAAVKQFREGGGSSAEEVVSLAEISTKNMLDPKPYPLDDLLARIDMLSTVGLPALVTDLPEFYRLEAYLSRYSKRDLLFVVGAELLQLAFREEYYEKFEGGAFEALGRLFKRWVRIVVYPARQRHTNRLLTAEERQRLAADASSTGVPGGERAGRTTARVPGATPWRGCARRIGGPPVGWPVLGGRGTGGCDLPN